MARRPPNRMASIGTPAGSSHSGAIAGSLRGRRGEAGVGVRGRRARRRASSPRRCQSIRCAGGSSVMPSHQTSPSSVSAQLVKIELCVDRQHRVGVGLRRWCPGATPKKPASGLIAYSRPSAPNFIQAMSSPIVSTFQPGKGRDQHRQVGLAAGRRERAGDVLDLALGRGQLQDQHVLGHPALVAGHAPRRCAARSTSCRAARCRRSRSRKTRSRASRGSGRCTCSRRCRARARPASPGSSGAPTECRQGTNSPSPPSTSSAPVPMRVMIRMRHRHVGRVGELDADVGHVRAERAHARRAPRTSCGPSCEPVEQRPSASPASRRDPASCWSGPASLLGAGADEGPVLDPGHVVGIRAAPGRSSGAWRPTAARRCPASTSSRTEPVVLLGRTVAPVDLVRFGQGRHLLDPRQQTLVLGRGGKGRAHRCGRLL